MSTHKDEKNGTWYVMVRYHDWKGVKRQKCKRGFATRREAQEWERNFQLQTDGDPDMTFEAFLELYEHDMRPRLKENTWLSKEHMIRTKLLPTFGKKMLSEIETRDIIVWQNELLAYRDEKKQPYSPTYLKSIHNQLVAILNHAVRHYGLKSNPASKVGYIGSKEAEEMQFWTKEEYQRFAEAVMDKPMSYLPRARSFDTFCAHEHPECSELTEWLILEWLRPVMKKEPAVIHQRICFMNGFARYLNNVGKPAFMMHNRFACGRTLFVPYIFSDDDLTRLFHVIDTNGKHGNLFQRIQFSVYYRLIYTCGLRPNEGRTLRKKHVDLHAGEIVIECSKERRSRIVVMSDDMRALAARYSSLLNACFPDTEFFFPSKHGREYPATFFQTNLVRFFAEANPAIPADFLPRVRVYDLRHRFATAAIHRWLEQGKPVDTMLPYLQMYMGHARLSSTAYYIHLLPEHLVKASGMNWEEIGDILPGVELWQD